MRGVFLILTISVSMTSAATEVLPAVAFAEVALRAARLAPRALSPESAREARVMFDKATTNGTWRLATATDVAKNHKVEAGILTVATAADLRASSSFVAREFVGEVEIQDALGSTFAHLNSFGLDYLAALNRRYPPTRWTEYLRLGVWPTATMLVAALGTESLETLAAQVPLAMSTVYHHERRARERREARAGVPNLERHLRLIARATTTTTEDRRVGAHRVFSMVRARAMVTPEVHQILFNAHERLSAHQFDRLIEAGRRVTSRWTDAEPPVDETQEITVESIVYSQADAADPSLHWILAYSATPRANVGGGIPVKTSCQSNLALRSTSR